MTCEECKSDEYCFYNEINCIEINTENIKITILVWMKKFNVHSTKNHTFIQLNFMLQYRNRHFEYPMFFTQFSQLSFINPAELVFIWKFPLFRNCVIVFERRTGCDIPIFAKTIDIASEVIIWNSLIYSASSLNLPNTIICWRIIEILFILCYL